AVDVSFKHDFRDYFKERNLPKDLIADKEFVRILQNAAEKAYENIVAPRRAGAKANIQRWEDRIRHGRELQLQNEIRN
ncbi:hypothetical protein HK096_000743, partial [Nowakowskiella sp. JEL0078]